MVTPGRVEGKKLSFVFWAAKGPFVWHWDALEHECEVRRSVGLCLDTRGEKHQWKVPRCVGHTVMDLAGLHIVVLWIFCLLSCRSEH